MTYIKRDVYERIVSSLSSHSPEQGGILGANENGIITEFYFDITGKNTPDSYTPDVTRINQLIESDWTVRGIEMVGIVHSHSNSGSFPSCGDLYYCEQIMKASELDSFLLPIVTLAPFSFHFYKITLKNKQFRALREEFQIV